MLKRCSSKLCALCLVLSPVALADTAVPHSMASAPIGLTFWASSRGAAASSPLDVRFRTYASSAPAAYIPGKMFGLMIYIR